MRFSTFPRPYRDEILYSVLARFLRFEGITQNIGSASDVLFGQRRLIPNITLPGGLRHIAGRIPSELGISANELLDKHTLYNYLIAFETDSQKELVKSTLLESVDKTLPFRSPHMMPFVERLRYCINCNMETLADERVRDIYWHRKHQLPGIDVCPVHGIPLLLSEIRTGSTLATVNYVAATNRTCPSSPIATACPGDPLLIAELFDVGKEAMTYLDRQDDEARRLAVLKHWRKQLADNGLMNHRQLVRRTAAWAAFRERWPAILGLHPHLLNPGVWFGDILTGAKTRNSVILHVMVSQWLSNPGGVHSHAEVKTREQPSSQLFRKRPMTDSERNSRDREITQKIRIAGTEIKSAYPYVRVTKASMARHLKMRDLIKVRGIKNLPLAIDALLEQIETTEQYLIRRAEAECARMAAEGVPIFYSYVGMRLNVARTAEVNKVLKDVVRKFIGNPID